MARVFEKVNKTRKSSLKYQIVLLRTRLAIHLVYRAPAEILTKADVIHVNLTIALFFPFHELHVRRMQIYQKLVLHEQIEQDFSYRVRMRASKPFFKDKLSKKVTCFSFKIMLW